jgi:iron complex outermembrane receptor protein
VDDATLYLNAGLPLGDEWSAYGWAGYQNRDGSAAATPRVGNNSTSPNVNNDARIYPNGFLPIITTDVDDIALGFGARGAIGGWDSDVSIVYGQNKIDYGVEETLNGALVDPTGATPTQTTFNAGGLEYDQLTFNFGMVRGFDFGLAGPANLAFGVEARRETFEITAGEPNSYGPVPPNRPIRTGTTPGAQGFPGFQPSDAAETGDADRFAVGGYVDLEAQITEKLRASAAVRAEDYEDFGSNVSGKLAGRFDFTRAFALRGALSTGFRAPGVQQQYFSSTATNFIGATSIQTRTLPVSSTDTVNTVPLLNALGARPLDAEESVNYSVGAVFRAGSFEATVDAYRIDIDDRIVLTENIQLGGGAAARFFTNGVDTETKGVDLVLRYVAQLGGAGALNLTLVGNTNDTDVTRRPATAPNGQLLFNNANLIILQDATPDDKVSFVADWSRAVAFGRLGVSAKATRYGDITDPGTAANGSLQYEVEGRTLVDLEFRGTIGEAISLALGVDNVFDQYPNPTPTSGVQNNNGLLGFSRFSPYGFNGRFVYGRVGFSF